jgi:predicted Zn-dependent peptidase
MSTATRPQPAPPRAYHFPAFERRTLANGVRLVVAPVRKLPLVTALVVVEAGAVAEPEGREGLAHLTAKLLLEGTSSSEGAELTERVERLGASVDAYADWDAAVVRLSVLTTRLDAAMRLLGEIVLEPAFAEREVERLKAEQLAELLQLRAEPRGLADEMFARFTYDPSSRYSRPADGSERSVEAIDRADVRRFYESRYRAGGITLVLAGDVDADAAHALAERTFGSMAAGAVAPASTPDRPARGGRAVHLVAKEDAPQSEIRVGHVGVSRRHPDYFPIVVMNALLGGLFSSRINLNLREEHAYTYGARSEFDWRRGAGPFVVSTAVKSDVTDAAAREILREIDRMRGEPVRDDELSLATSYLDGVFPIRYETTAAIASALANLTIYALSDDYFDRYRAAVRAVTVAAVREAAERHLHPERLQLLVVGDPSVVRGPLDRLGFGPLAVHDATGAPLP